MMASTPTKKHFMTYTSFANYSKAMIGKCTSIKVLKNVLKYIPYSYNSSLFLTFNNKCKYKYLSKASFCDIILFLLEKQGFIISPNIIMSDDEYVSYIFNAYLWYDEIKKSYYVGGFRPLWHGVNCANTDLSKYKDLMHCVNLANQYHKYKKNNFFYMKILYGYKIRYYYGKDTLNFISKL